MKSFVFPRTSLEAQGIHSAAIANFIDMIEKNGLEMHSFILLRHGVKVAQGWWQPYAPTDNHQLYSLSKSFTSTAVGLAVGEGLLSVEDRVISFFPDKLPQEVDKNLSEMRVKHLLSMSTGHAEDTTQRVRELSGDDWVKNFLSLPVENPPGAPFVYNTAATYMLSAIVQKLTGKTVLDYLKPRLFEPLGIENPEWETCPKGISTGGWGLSICTEDIARFGQLYLQKGVWEGRRLISEEWIAEATGKRVSNGSDPNSDWTQGYGYQFWRCRHGAYRGDGAFGQYCIVMPDQDAVLAITSGLGDMQAVMNFAWDILLPAMESGEIPENPEATVQLTNKLCRLSLSRPYGELFSNCLPKGSSVSYEIDDNPLHIKTIKISPDGKNLTLSVVDDHAEHIVQLGYGAWKFGKTTLIGPNGQTNPVAAAAVWTKPEQLECVIRYVLTPFTQTIVSTFIGETIEVDVSTNVSFGPTAFPRLIGKKVS